MERVRMNNIYLQVEKAHDKLKWLQNTACKLQEQIKDISLVLVGIKTELQQFSESEVASDNSLSSCDASEIINYVDGKSKTHKPSIPSFDDLNNFSGEKITQNGPSINEQESHHGEVSRNLLGHTNGMKELSKPNSHSIGQGTMIYARQEITEQSISKRFKRKATKPGCDNRKTFLDCEKEQSLSENHLEGHNADIEADDTTCSADDHDASEAIITPSLSPYQRNVSSSQHHSMRMTDSLKESEKLSRLERAVDITHSVESDDDMTSPPLSVHPIRIQPVEPQKTPDEELLFNENSPSGESSESDVPDDDFEEEIVDAPDVVVLEEQQLEKLTLEEASGADNCHDPKSHGADTILCVDVSDSMKGSLKDMQEFMYRFIEGIEDSAVEFSLEENISIVTFGAETKILQNLTNDYTKVRDVIENLQLGGPSPMMTGLVFCMSAIYNRGGEVQYKDRKISPRIILLTDGKPTDQRIFNGPDAITKQGHDKKEIWRKLMEFAERIRSYGESRQLVCVPFGDNPDMEMLRLMSNTASGRIAHPTDVEAHRLSRNFMLETVAARLVHDGLLKNGLPEESTLHEKVQTAQDGYEPTDQEINDAIVMIKKEYERLGAFAGFEEGEIDGEEREMPQIGTRVRRGPNWKWAEQDSNTVGTIIAHRDRGWLSVEWDSGYKGKYRYGAEGGAKDVRVVDEPRILPQGMMAAVGCKATRDSDWEWGNQDGGEGAVGIIFKIEDSGVIHIRWENGRRGNYRFGLYGKFDVKICESAQSPVGGGQASTHVYGVYQQWQWMDANGDWNDFPRASSDKIESFYKKRNGKGTVIVNSDKEDVRVMVEKWTYRGISTGLEGPLRRVEEETSS